jgi:CRP-like cAMP-binding protein
MIVIMHQHFANLPHSVRTFRKNQYLFHQGDLVGSLFFIVSGEARLVRRHRNGSAAVLQRATAGRFLAEASLFTSHYHCDSIASSRVSARLIAKSAMHDLFQRDVAFAMAWAIYLADEVRHARLRAEILSLRTVTERLDAWVANQGSFPAKGTWKAVAQEIGTSSEALYREIASRRKTS